MNVIPKRTQDIKPFIVMDVLNEAQKMERAGESVIRLEIGEPDFPTPTCVIHAVRDALDTGATKYTSSLGLIELRESIAENYFKSYGVNVSPDQIIVTEGTSPALLLIFAALLEKGDSVLLSNPYYACYPNFISFFSGKPDYFPVLEKDGYLYDIERIKKKNKSKTKAIIINSPSNPTGKTQSKEILEQVAQLGPYIISDEIYHGLTYGIKEHTILEFTDKAFVLNGFSKRYAMTGWRLGYLIAPKEFIRPIEKLQQNFFISANSFVQWAGLAALKFAGPDIEKMRQTYNERRKYIVPELRRIGFKIKYEPDGAYYVLANIKKYSNNSLEFANEILHQAKVAVTPGIDFGSKAEGYIRFSYANSLDNIKEAILRLELFLKNRHK